MLHTRAVNIRYDGYCSIFWNFGLELNKATVLPSPANWVVQNLGVGGGKDKHVLSLTLPLKIVHFTAAKKTRLLTIGQRVKTRNETAQYQY